jgi:hypothetical protein
MPLEVVRPLLEFAATFDDSSNPRRCHLDDATQLVAACASTVRRALATIVMAKIRHLPIHNEVMYIECVSWFAQERVMHVVVEESLPLSTKRRSVKTRLPQ